MRAFSLQPGDSSQQYGFSLEMIYSYLIPNRQRLTVQYSEIDPTSSKAGSPYHIIEEVPGTWGVKGLSVSSHC